MNNHPERAMAVDMTVWKKLVLDEVRSISDEQSQRSIWFGHSTDRIGSPGEQFCRFFDNASVPEFLARSDNGLNERQACHLSRLTELMDHLADNTPTFIKPENLIDDPRWIEIREQAAKTLKALHDGN